MAAIYFEDLKEIIERGLANGMPRDARLVMLGQILYARITGELSPEEAHQLEELIGLPEDWRRLQEFAIFGDDEEYQREEQELARA